MIARVLFLCGLLLCQWAHAQSPPPSADPDGGDAANKRTSNESGPQRFWQFSSASGHYMVAIDRISAIGRHEYLLNGGVKATEVTIDTQGQALARFYYLEPITPNNSASVATDRAKDLIDRVNQHVSDNPMLMVQKTYPETTHARTIEFRLASISDLEALYKSLQSTLESGRGKKFGVK